MYTAKAGTGHRPDNSVGVKGDAALFAEMLLKNKTLKVLDLRDDSIGKEGAQQLNDSLTHNNSVTLWLPQNIYCAPGVK